MNFLTNKFKNEIYHLAPKGKKTASTVEASTSKIGTKVKKELHRGIVHWQPPPKSGENEQSHHVHKAWLQKESKKEEKNKDAIKERMELTYAFRRIYINTDKRPIKDIMGEYPCLFEEDEVRN